MEQTGTVIDPGAFQAYTQLRKIAADYDMEDELEVPQLVVVGETSAGKSMLIQNFIRFPCTFAAVDVATRCPVAYRLTHNPRLKPGQIRIVHPENVDDPSQLSVHLKNVMERIKHDEPTGFSSKLYQVELESAEYTDFEIVDVPGLVTGSTDPKVRATVEKLVEVYVRNPRFSIVLLKEASQLKVNATGARCISDLCTASKGRATEFPPRLDYKNHMITIQTKFDTIMKTKNGTTVNEIIQKLHDEFGETYFVNMIFDGYSMDDNSYEENVQYIADLPGLEKQRVNEWIDALNEAAGQPSNKFQKFNPAYRKLIGIDVVRRQIQQLWLKAFRGALPKLNNTMQSYLQEANEKYKDVLTTYKLQNPHEIQETYLEYIEKFKATLCLYAAYRSEIFKDFPADRCGKTYSEMENHFKNSWDRYQPLTWRAYRSADELAQISDGKALKLDLKLVGVSHFDRLDRVFQYMILEHDLNAISEDGMVSATGILYGSLNDYDNLEKAVREWTRTLLFDTFVVGVAWLTQMHIYMLDMFKQSVKLYLLAPGKFNSILQHTIFLNAVDREYHKTVRRWIRKAVQTIRDTYESFGAYAHYDITARLRKLAFAIPTHVQHNSFEQIVPNVFTKCDGTEHGDGYTPATIADILKNIPEQKILDRIYGSESYLTQQRDQQKLNHHDNGRCVIEEIYRATCGLLISHIISLFNSNVVVRIQEYGSSKMFGFPSGGRSLYSRISRMLPTEIGRIANVNVEQVQYEIKQCENKIRDLMVAQRLVSNAAKAMLSSSVMNEEQQKREHIMAKELADKHVRGLQMRRGNADHQLRMEQTSYAQSLSASMDVDVRNSNERNYHDESEVEEDQLMNEGDKMQGKMLMLEYYRRHDKEDLSLGLDSMDCLSQDESRPSTLAHIYVDPGTMDYDSVINNVPIHVIQSKPDVHVPLPITTIKTTQPTSERKKLFKEQQPSIIDKEDDDES